MAYKKKLRKFLNIIRNNDRIQSEFFEIEKTIMRIHTFNDLISTLLKELKNRFDLSHVGITFFKNENTKMLNLESFSKNVGKLFNVTEHCNETRFLLKNSMPRLENSNLESWKRFFPARILNAAGSLAVVPLTVDKKLIGTLNLADKSKERYAPSQATQFLERLAIIISISIDNVIIHERLKLISISDPLTGLANRRHFYNIVEKELKRAQRYNESFSIVYMDLNDFKRINDSYGHDIGDLYLKHVSSILEQECRDIDCVSRFGGDEFVIALSRSDYKDAKITKKRIQNKLSQNPLVLGRRSLPVFASFGVASIENGKNLSVDELLKEADRKLYIEKKKKYQKISNE